MAEISTQAIGALIQAGIPTSPQAAAMPAYSAQMVPKLANNKPTAAT